MSAPAPAGGEAIASSDFVMDVSLSAAWHDTLAQNRPNCQCGCKLQLFIL
jgi:hypothetical protein